MSLGGRLRLSFDRKTTLASSRRVEDEEDESSDEERLEVEGERVEEPL